MTFMHEHRAMALKLEKVKSKGRFPEFTLMINGVYFDELEDVPVREREPLARSTTSIDMSGSKK